MCIGVSTPHRGAMYVRASGFERRGDLGESCCSFGLVVGTYGFTSG